MEEDSDVRRHRTCDGNGKVQTQDWGSVFGCQNDGMLIVVWYCDGVKEIEPLTALQR